MTDNSMCWFAPQKLSSTNRANKLTVPNLHLASHRYRAWPPPSFPSLVRVVIRVREAAFLRELAVIAGIIDDQVGVAAQLNRALLRIEPEQLRGLRRAGVHHGLQGQPAGGDAAGVDQIHPLLN